MDFTARLKRTSTIWHDWRGAHRLSGLIGGVLFRFVPGQDYVSDVLEPEHVMALQHHASVVLEVASNVALSSVMVPVTAEEPDAAELDRIFQESLRDPEPVVRAVINPLKPLQPPSYIEDQRPARYAGQQNPRSQHKGRR